MNQQQINLALTQLDRIERAAKMARRGAGSPASASAFAMGLVGGASTALLGSLVSPFLAVAAGVAGFYAVYAIAIGKSKLPHSYAAKAYLLLAAYEPVDVAGYRHLQECARDGLESEDVLKWVRRERAALIPPKPSERDLARRAFTDRRI
ncbi:hypothetical protein [Ralstonia solanacearum]|uniref:hypothetical protein n=1 Tax=Ralstonia solanacearum TaxID=305 RepID=UPI0012D4363C|nr:hypothetical protein [Ralstonia solanacearum]MDC6177118.1 hypothetical protein [Ralstonia solanacearum]MDC6238350.1 hypothetical protein [Ralstonia solanacearum]